MRYGAGPGNRENINLRGGRLRDLSIAEPSALQLGKKHMGEQELKAKAKKVVEEANIPTSPLWHMGKVARFEGRWGQGHWRATGVRSCSNAFCSATADAWRIAGLQDLTPGLTELGVELRCGMAIV